MVDINASPVSSVSPVDSSKKIKLFLIIGIILLVVIIGAFFIINSTINSANRYILPQEYLLCNAVAFKNSSVCSTLQAVEDRQACSDMIAISTAIKNKDLQLCDSSFKTADGFFMKAICRVAINKDISICNQAPIEADQKTCSIYMQYLLGQIDADTASKSMPDGSFDKLNLQAKALFDKAIVNQNPEACSPIAGLAVRDKIFNSQTCRALFEQDRCSELKTS